MVGGWVAEYAFHYAKAKGRDRVSAIHKANIMQNKFCWEVAEKYPDIKYEKVIIDNCCMMVHPYLNKDITRVIIFFIRSW
ncbi:putative 3-isopropylmalate dehydrogenase [Helianthus anomalus]